MYIYVWYWPIRRASHHKILSWQFWCLIDIIVQCSKHVVKFWAKVKLQIYDMTNFFVAFLSEKKCTKVQTISAHKSVLLNSNRKSIAQNVKKRDDNVRGPHFFLSSMLSLNLSPSPDTAAGFRPFLIPLWVFLVCDAGKACLSYSIADGEAELTEMIAKLLNLFKFNPSKCSKKIH